METYTEAEKKEAMRLYETYCAGVGGVAYDGKPLPSAVEFFGDETKARQREGWLLTARTVLQYLESMAAASAEDAGGMGGKLGAAAAKVAAKAKAASGWRKWLWGTLAVVLGAAAYFLSGCGQVTAEQVQAVHGVYHDLTGKPCVFGGDK
jgi:hypothetical protein